MSAVVEIDDPDVIAPEQRVVQVQIGVDEADLVGAFAQLRHYPLHAGGHPVEPRPEVTGNEVPDIRGVDSPVDHRVAEERFPVPADPREAGREAPLGGVIVQPGHDRFPAGEGALGRVRRRAHGRPSSAASSTPAAPARPWTPRSWSAFRRSCGRAQGPTGRCRLVAPSASPVRNRPRPRSRGAGRAVPAVHPEQKTITTIDGHRIDPERGVLAVSDKPQLRATRG